MAARGANLECSTSKGETLLTRAVACGHNRLVKLLVEKCGMHIDEPGYNQRTALQVAVANKDIVMVKQLIELNAQIPDSILNDVAQTGHLQLFRTLREHVRSLDQQDENGKFPLYYAIQNDAPKLVEELIKANAKITLRVGIF